MSSLPIAPDESGDVPRCQQECPYFAGQSFDAYVTCAISDPDLLRRSVCLPRVRELVALAGRVSEALDVALCCGGFDGAHHKAWVIDQMVRELAGDGYAAWVAAARDGEDGPETYSWDEGIAP